MAKKQKVATADGTALFKAILANPEEDTPRLVYADWLDENGDSERAEFIRVQCRLARIDAYDLERAHLVWRRNQLLTDARRKTWGELPVKPVKEKNFNRGFIDDVSLHASKFLEGADQLFAAIPLHTLRPLKIGPVWSELLKSPHLLRLRGLDLHNSLLSQIRCRGLAVCENLANLHELNLGANRAMSVRGFSAILGSKHLSNLRRLDLNGNDVGNEALREFINNPFFPNLRRLDLSRNAIGPAGVDHLARASWLSQLERLDLSYNPLGDEGVRKLAESGILSGAKTLELRAVGLKAAGVRGLANSWHLNELTDLYLEGEYNGGDFLKEFAQSMALPKLQALRLGRGTGVTKTGVEAFVRSPLAKRLRALQFATSQADAFKTLLTAPALSGLTWLDIRASADKGEKELGVGALLKSATHLRNLHHLEINSYSFGEKDLPLLAECAHFANLSSLIVRGTSVSEAAVDAFIASPHFTKLRQLSLPHRPLRLDDPIRQRLDARFGEGVWSLGY